MKPTITHSRNPVRGAQFALRVLIAVVVAVLGFTAPANTSRAAQWAWQNPVPTVNPLSGVFFIDQNTGWVIGDYGEISKTTDGGTHWSLQRIGTDPEGQRGRRAPTFNKLYFVDANIGWVVGANPPGNDDVSIILKTTDGGIHWTSQRSGSGSIVSVQFVDEFTGWAVDEGQSSSTILHTTDGGTNWAPQSDLPYPINALFFKRFHTTVPTVEERLLGWAVGGNGVILKTTNGGASWEPQMSGTNSALTSVDFPDNLRGWVVGFNGTIRITNDGGESWDFQDSQTSFPLFSVKFVNGEKGWAVGGELGPTNNPTGIILKTLDHGMTWTHETFQIGETNLLSDVSFVNENNGWVVGDNGIVLRTTDGGQTWLVPPESRGGLGGIQMLSDLNGWVVGAELFDGVILHTTNGGQSWTRQQPGPALISISFTDPTHGWIAGVNGTILNTMNGGQSWTPQNSSTTSTLLSIQMKNSSNGVKGWAVGNFNTIVHTEDGTNWATQTSPLSPFAQLESVYFVDTSFGWTVGFGDTSTGGVILKTTDGGAHWNVIRSGQEYPHSVYFIDQNTGWVAASGRILKTTDGGQTWSANNLPYNVRSIQFTDQNTGWVVGYFGWILKSVDGGTHWTPEPKIFSRDYHGVYFTNANTGWVIGSQGAILHTGCIQCAVVGGEDEAVDLKPDNPDVIDAVFVPITTNP